MSFYSYFTSNNIKKTVEISIIFNDTGIIALKDEELNDRITIIISKTSKNHPVI